MRIGKVQPKTVIVAGKTFELKNLIVLASSVKGSKSRSTFRLKDKSLGYVSSKHVHVTAMKIICVKPGKFYLLQNDNDIGVETNKTFSNPKYVASEGEEFHEFNCPSVTTEQKPLELEVDLVFNPRKFISIEGDSRGSFKIEFYGKEE